MKRETVLSFVLLAVFIVGAAIAVAQTVDDLALHKQCRFCGMDRSHFDFSRMLIAYEDGSSTAVCSIHCAAIDLANTFDKKIKSIQVGDFNDKHLLDAEKAYWVVGGKKPGVMSVRAKWAFESKAEAENFIKSNEGEPAGFEAAIKAAYEDMYADTNLIRERMAKKRMLSMTTPTPMVHP
ncbi:MAG: NosL family protein [Desulfobacteraceae bacterium]|nr:MAG: NosL family protein [Desulfobacteraceae bacterium]